MVQETGTTKWWFLFLHVCSCLFPFPFGCSPAVVCHCLWLFWAWFPAPAMPALRVVLLLYGEARLLVALPEPLRLPSIRLNVLQWTHYFMIQWTSMVRDKLWKCSEEWGTDVLTREHVVGAKLWLEPELCHILLSVSSWEIFLFILTKIYIQYW